MSVELLGLLWKVGVSAGIVILVSRVAQRSGPFVASVVIGLPLSAGPGFAFLAINHDEAFIAEGALFALAGTGPVLLYTVAYIAAAQVTQRFLLCLLAGSLGWLAASVPLGLWDVSLELAAAMIAGAAAAAYFARRQLDLHSPPGVAGAGWRFLAVRGLTAGIVVGAIGSSGHILGPALAGWLVSFPITTSTSAWLLHRQFGGVFAAATMASLQRSIASYASFNLVLSLLAGPLSSYAAIAVALAVAAGVAATLALLRRFFR